MFTIFTDQMLFLEPLLLCMADHWLDIQKYNRWKTLNSSRWHGSIDVTQSKALQVRIQNETGVSRTYMFKQHDTLYDHNLITIYDENYNGRWREKKLPLMRHWNFAHDVWLPGKSDHPLFGPISQFGFADNMKEKWQTEVSDKGIISTRIIK